MPDFKSFRKQLYEINNGNFHDLVFEAFHFQAANNLIYKSYIEHLGVDATSITKIEKIPFLPIAFFKTHKIKCGEWKEETIFESSGTTGAVNSKHYIDDLKFYYDHCLQNFKYFYGEPTKYHILGLLPSYLERENSSLVHMIQHLMEVSASSQSGYYLYNYDDLLNKLAEIASTEEQDRQIMLVGITFALLEAARHKALSLPKDTVVIETGGMKGRGKEMIRKEFHDILRNQWQLSTIHAEYGMTELLSQAYALGEGNFGTPPWMKIIIREINDPFGYTSGVGGINVIDLANIHSCSFIETQDIGKINNDGSFGVMGRFDNSDIRGCNLLWNN